MLVKIAIQRFVATREVGPVMLMSERLDWKVEQSGYRPLDPLYFLNSL
jgi:hypothetical protein